MSYCTDIADIIAGYRLKDRKNGDLRLNIDQYHVERWADQFPNNQEIILLETKNLLKQFYYTEENVSCFLTEICTSEELWGYNPEDAITKACFLNCQIKGSSQQRLWKKMSKIIENEYDIKLPKHPDYSAYSTFIYVDDCMFSGSTLRKDMQHIIPNLPSGSRVYAIFLMRYSFADWSVRKQLNDMFEKKGIDFKILSCKYMQNSGGLNHTFDCLRPQEYETKQLKEYLSILQKEHNESPDKKLCTFREGDCSSRIFTSEKNRCIFEQELMEAGLRIYNFPQDAKPYMRPMGYDNRISFGFGAFFATYMNMSNNCPLAYWWGDPNAGQWSPLGKWYPLLPRRTNDTENAW